MAFWADKNVQVVFSEPDANMRKQLEQRIMESNRNYFSATSGSAEKINAENDTYDFVVSALVCCSVTNVDASLNEIKRVLKPGGRLLVLEFSKPESPLLSKIYDTYSFSVLPKLGQLITQDAESYQYLAESIRMHPDQDTLKDMMIDAGFANCEYHNMTGGVVALHKGTKP